MASFQYKKGPEVTVCSQNENDVVDIGGINIYQKKKQRALLGIDF